METGLVPPDLSTNDCVGRSYKAVNRSVPAHLWDGAMTGAGLFSFLNLGAHPLSLSSLMQIVM